jgi:mannose-1-phosphate guanylyltransferase
MKIRPVILCGGAGTRLWPKSKNNISCVVTISLQNFKMIDMP